MIPISTSSRLRPPPSSRLLLRSRLKCCGLLALLLVIAAAGVYSSDNNQAGRARTAARVQQNLRGFPEARVTELVPVDLRTTSLSERDLLSHPLLSYPTPICDLTDSHQSRYAPLRPAYRAPSGTPASPRNLPRLTYLIALNLYSSATVLPSLIKAIHAVATALGPSRFHVSIYENASTDTTPAQLYLLAQLLDRLGVGYTIVSSPELSQWAEGMRIDALAELRNLALQPLFDAPPGTFDRVLFINDVVLCEADLLELILQHEVQGADMSCGMDYKTLRVPEFASGGYPVLFYDVWVARDMLGLPFLKIEYPSGTWALPSLPLPTSPSRYRLHSLLPFQVYSCWNGISLLDASLFLPPHSLRFHSQNHTAIQSECYLLCSDIWRTRSPFGPAGRRAIGGRIQVVPRVSVGYEISEYEAARQSTNVTAFEGGRTINETVDWKPWPPKLVSSYPYAKWDKETWIPPF